MALYTLNRPWTKLLPTEPVFLCALPNGPLAIFASFFFLFYTVWMGKNKTLPLTSNSCEYPCKLSEESSETWLMKCFTWMTLMSSEGGDVTPELNHLRSNRSKARSATCNTSLTAVTRRFGIELHTLRETFFAIELLHFSFQNYLSVKRFWQVC